MRIRVFRTTVAYAACMFLGVSIASAQATRTWVSGVGDDVNPCSRTAPCKTFAGAISKTAAGGEISVLDPGGFGGVTITKSITISGVGYNASILAPTSTSGIIINAGANDVITLRDLQINGAGSGAFGIRMLAGAALVVDKVNVFGFDTGSVSIEDSMLTNNNVAVQATLGGTVRLSNNSVYNNLTGFGCGGGMLVSAGNNRKANNVGGSVPACAPTTTIAIQ
jgi:hypothetical protein